MIVKVENGFPIPGKNGRRNSWPFRDMEIGQSFSVPVDQSATPRSMMNRYGAKKFISRTVIENGGKVCRFWRVE